MKPEQILNRLGLSANIIIVILLLVIIYYLHRINENFSLEGFSIGAPGNGTSAEESQGVVWSMGEHGPSLAVCNALCRISTMAMELEDKDPEAYQDLMKRTNNKPSVMDLEEAIALRCPGRGWRACLSDENVAVLNTCLEACSSAEEVSKHHGQSLDRGH